MPAVVFIVNGTLAKASARVLSACRDAAGRGNWSPEILVTDKAGAGICAARDAAAAGADLVVAVGGDGTVRGCAEGLAGTCTPLAIVPLGTGNLLSRTLGIPARPPDALALALAVSRTAAAHRQIDLATADGVPFTAMAGMGLDARVVSATRFKHHLGWLAYAMTGAAHLALPAAGFTLRLDGGKPLHREAVSVVVGNSGLLPGGFSLLPRARVDDGVLDVGVLAPHGPLGWATVAARVLTRSRHDDRHLERFQARRAEITATECLPREVDGDMMGPARTLTVAVRPGALRVKVPASD